MTEPPLLPAHTTGKLRAPHLALHLVLAALALTAMFALALGASLEASPTFDEGFYIARGWAFLRTGRLLPLGHPPLTNVLSGLGVLLEPGLPDPVSLDGWRAGNAERVSEDLLWHSGIDTTRVTLLARLPIMWLGLLMGAVVYRWGREAYGRWSAFLALLLTAFCPNILAHTGLATTDLGVALFFILTLYAWTRFLRLQTRGWLILSGIALGLAQASKFSALVLIPILGVMTLWAAWRHGPIRIPFIGARYDVHLHNGLAIRIISAFAALGVMGLIGLVALWASYLFNARPDPLGAYIAEFQHFLGLASEGHRAYLMGRFSETGWWYYHPVVLAAKLTLPSLILLAVALTLALGRNMRPNEWEIVVPAVAYLGFTMLGSLNVGIRYLLPMLPLIFLYISRIASGPLSLGNVRPGVLSVLAGAHVVISVWRFPYYIPFFNIAAGGPDAGLRLLADSNLDWGQDLPALARYLQDRGIGAPIYLSYFGQADPAYYGINYTPLPGWPPPEPDPDRPDFYPLNPAPGLYAISASNLVGVQMYEPDTFGYFRAQQPVARLGHSIYIYEVAPADTLGPGSGPAWFAQCAAPDPSEAEEQLEALTGRQDVQYIYFDCSQALAFATGPGWVLLQKDFEPVIDLGEPDYLARTEGGLPRYSVWQIQEAPAAPESTVEFPSVAMPIPIANHLELLGHAEQIDGELQPGETLTVIAWWRVREPPPPPVSIFAHLLRPDDTLLVAGDGLGVTAEYWRPGMVFVQQHTFVIPEDAPTGSYALSVGLYSLATGDRFPVAQTGDRVIDRIVLTTVMVRGQEEAGQ